MANSFELKESSIPLKPKLLPEQEPEQAAIRPAVELPLPTPRPKKKQYSVYMNTEIMGWAQQLAKQQGVTIGELLEAFIKMAREQMEGET